MGRDPGFDMGEIADRVTISREVGSGTGCSPTTRRRERFRHSEYKGTVEGYKIGLPAAVGVLSWDSAGLVRYGAAS